MIGLFSFRPKAGDSSSDEEAKEVSAASCQERLQPGDGQHYNSPHTYRKSLRLSSAQIVSNFRKKKILLYYASTITMGCSFLLVVFFFLSVEHHLLATTELCAVKATQFLQGAL